jgi:uncharacterized Tic20 family protein
MPDPEFTHPPDPGPGTPPPLLAPPALPAAPVSVAASGPSVNARGRFVDPAVPHEQRTYAILMHASIVLVIFLPFFSCILPLVMWLGRRQASRFIDDQGREALNFHLSITLYGLVSFALFPLCGIGMGLLVATYILAIIGGLMACLAAMRAEYFRYPMCVRFVT